MILFDFQVTIPGNQPISRFCYPEINQSPGYHTRKLSNQAKGKVLWFVSMSLKNSLHSQHPDIVTRRLRNLQFTISGNCATSRYRYLEIAMKKAFFGKFLCENKIFFKNILGVYSKAYLPLIHKKTQSSKISCYCPYGWSTPMAHFTSCWQNTRGGAGIM